MLNSVDLPQPDGPITARNSPGATVKEMRSTATSGPSGVSKRFDTSPTTRIGSAAAAAASTRAVEAEGVTGKASPPLLRHRPRRRAIQYSVTAQLRRSAHHAARRVLDCPLSRAMTE